MSWTRAAGLLATATLLLAPYPAPAVVVLDSTWREEGGRLGGREAEGFAAHIALAGQPQFRSLVTLSYDGGREWGVGSGTWIGNDEAHGYVLTSAHNFDDTRIEEVLFRTEGGSVLRGDRVSLHPGYRTEGDHTGVDVAIVRLVRPVTDAGPAPVLYSGNAEKGRTITFVGFGTRGIGSVGEDERFNAGTGKAAAQGVVDEAVALRKGGIRQEDPGNYLSVFLPREDGSVANPISGARRPVSRYAGLLGSGDSGGSAWMPLGDGWVIVGINTSGDGEAQYGDSSWFVRVSGVRPWIASIFPDARFMGDTGIVAAPAPAPTLASAPPVLQVSVPEDPSPTADGCAPRRRFFVRSDGAWYPATALGPGRREGSCRVRFDDFGAEEDETVGPDRLIPWSADGPGRRLSACRTDAEVLVEEDGVWYPATVDGAGRRGCDIVYEDEDYDDETVPLARLRLMPR